MSFFHSTMQYLYSLYLFLDSAAANTVERFGMNKGLNLNLIIQRCHL